MNLLIVDDEIYAIQGLISSVDWSLLDIDEILTANSYAQAVNVFSKNKGIDIVLCDIEMPFGSGLDLVKWIKEHYPETECIFLTCHDEFDFARRAVSLSCLDYVLKPVEPLEISRVIKHAQDVISTKRKTQKYEELGRRYMEDFGKPTRQQEEFIPKDVVNDVKQYIYHHIEDPIVIEEMAKLFYMSADYLTRLFKRDTGKTVIDYITEQRMTMAKELIEQNRLSLTMISAKVGYNNYSYFTKIFKKFFGQTPREYRGVCIREKYKTQD